MGWLVTTIDNIYDKVRHFATVLRHEGKGGFAEKLDDAISYGSTATEILMAVKWHLEQLKEEMADLSPDSQDSVRQLVKEIELLLG